MLVVERRSLRKINRMYMHFIFAAAFESHGEKCVEKTVRILSEVALPER